MTDGSGHASDAPLLAQLKDTARQEAEQHLGDARREAEGILAEARERSARRLERSLDERRTALERDREQQRAAARVEAGRITLAARERLVERVLAAAPDRACLLRDSEAAHVWLRDTLHNALRFLPEGPVIVSTDDPRAIEVAGDVAPGRTVSIEPLDDPGMRARTADGTVLIDATLERHVRAARARLAIAIVATVTGDA